MRTAHPLARVMKTGWREFKGRLDASLWPLPLAAALVGAALGAALPMLDRSGTGHPTLEGIPALATLLGARADSAESILIGIAGALATILSVLFSITIVALQLASSQYSPRVLRRFRGDRLSQAVLALFLGTLVLVVVALPTLPDDPPPRLTLLVVLALSVAAFASVALFLHHLARQIDTATIVRTIGQDTIHLARKMDFRTITTRPPGDDDGAATLRSTGTGYLLRSNTARLLARLPPQVREARVEARAGDFILPGMPLLRLWPRADLDERQVRRLCEAFPLAQQRAIESDLLLGVRELVDVALKALSEVVGDITTAVMAINELGAIVREVQVRDPPVEDAWQRFERDGQIVWEPIVGLRSLLRHAFDEIARQAGAQLRVQSRILEVLEQVIEATHPSPAHRAAYAEIARSIAHSADHGGATEVERAYFEERRLSVLRRASGITLPDEEPALH